MDGTNLLHYHFYPLLKRAELPRIRFHDLRHTAATLLLGRGVNPKIVSEMLGRHHTRYVQPCATDDAAIDGGRDGRSARTSVDVSFCQ
jgi:integrase